MDYKEIINQDEGVTEAGTTEGATEETTEETTQPEEGTGTEGGETPTEGPATE